MSENNFESHINQNDFLGKSEKEKEIEIIEADEEAFHINRIIEWQKKESELIGFEGKITNQNLSDAIIERIALLRGFERDNPEYSNFINKAQDIIKKTYPEASEDFDIHFYLKFLDHKEYQKKTKKESSIAHYWTNNRAIYIDCENMQVGKSRNDDVKSLQTFIHEYLHLISHRHTKKDVNGDIIINVGIEEENLSRKENSTKNHRLNELMTDYLTFKAMLNSEYKFNSDFKYKDFRSFSLMRIIENISGLETMKRAYFFGDMKGFIESINCLNKRMERNKYYDSKRFEKLSRFMDERDFKNTISLLNKK